MLNGSNCSLTASEGDDRRRSIFYIPLYESFDNYLPLSPEELANLSASNLSICEPLKNERLVRKHSYDSSQERKKYNNTILYDPPIAESPDESETTNSTCSGRTGFNKRPKSDIDKSDEEGPGRNDIIRRIAEAPSSKFFALDMKNDRLKSQLKNTASCEPFIICERGFLPLSSSMSSNKLFAAHKSPSKSSIMTSNLSLIPDAPNLSPTKEKSKTLPQNMNVLSPIKTSSSSTTIFKTPKITLTPDSIEKSSSRMSGLNFIRRSRSTKLSRSDSLLRSVTSKYIDSSDQSEPIITDLKENYDDFVKESGGEEKDIIDVLVKRNKAQWNANSPIGIRRGTSRNCLDVDDEVAVHSDTSYEKACRRGSAPSSPAPGAPPPGHSPSRLAAFFFSKRSFRGGNPLKRTKSATKLERERAMLAAAGQPGAAHSALHALRTSRSHESLLSAHSPAVSTMDLGPPHQVEIRALHASVLGRPHCFALSAEGRAPRYFACASRRECDRWIYSLKQAARPGEMRGRRTERSLRLWVQEAKALPPKKRYYCEITLDDTLYARTSSKLKTEMCFWGEVFEFASLPAVRNVCINVYREPDRKPRKHTKHTLVGTVKIPVDDVSSRYLSERWYPVVPEGSEKSSPGSGSGNTPTDRTPPPSLRVKCRYQVTDVLPIDAYSGFLDYLKRNYKKVCEYLEPVIGVKAKEDIGCALVLAMQGVGRAPRFLADVVALDVKRTGDHSLTFRGNSLATKSMEAYLKVVGDQYLQETLGDAVSLAAAAGAECEVDPARGSGGGGGGALRRRQAALRQAVEVTWARVADSAQRFPPDLRECFATFRERLTAMGREDISDNLISASIFLRFLCPAILSPSLFGITHEFPSERAARNLTLIAKTLQTLANFTRFQGKEAFMEFLNDFLEKEAPRMKTFLREISTRAPSSQRNSDPSASSVSEEQAGQSWAPHADMGRQLAVLHGLLADCLTKLPPGRVQELDPLPEILEELSRRQSCPDGGASPSVELADNIFRFNDPTCNNKLGESLPTPNFAHSSPLPAQNPNENKYADKNTYATISKSPSFNTRAATLPRNGYPPSVNPDRYSSQYNNQEHCVNLKVIQIGLDATPYAKTPIIKQVSGRNSNLDVNAPQIVTNDKKNERFNNKMNNFNQQNFYNNHNGAYGQINDNYYPENVQSLRKETANLDELSDLLKYADDQDIDVVEEKLNVRKNNLMQSHSNNNVTGGLKSHNYGNTNGSNMSISGNSNVASSGYQSFATYSQSSSPIEPQTNHMVYDNNNGQPLSRYSQMNNYNKQRERFYDGKNERIYPTKNATQQKIEYDLQKYGIQNFTTDDGSQPIKNGSTTNLAPLVFTNPVYSMENGITTNRPTEKDCIRNVKKYGDMTNKPNKRCGCESSSSSMDEEGMTTDNPETNSEEGAPNFGNNEIRHENGSYDRLNNLQNKTLSYDRNSNRTSSSAESNYSHRKLTRDINGYEPDYITKQGVEINNEEADYKRNYKQENDSPNNSPSIRKIGKTRMPRTNPSLSYSNNQNQLNLKHFGQRGDAIYETINNNGNNENYTTNNRSESNVEEVNKEMYRLQISRSQQAIYNGMDNRQALMNALHNSPRSDKNYNLERNYSAANVPNETNYKLERNYSASNVSGTRLNDELNSQQVNRYGKCCNELRQSPSSAKVRSGLGLNLGTGEKVKEKLQRRLSLESARELTDSSSDMEDNHYSTTGRRRTKGNHRTIEQYEREIERLQCSVELLRQKLESAGDASDHDHSSDTKMKAIISRLICVEEELRREQQKMSLALSHKQRVIEAQEHRIAALDAANTRLLSALTNLQQRAPPAPPVPPTPPHEVQI